MSTLEIQDSDDEAPPFQFIDWKGKKYPKNNISITIQREKRHLLTIPLAPRHFLPNTNISITSFIYFALPKISSQLILTKPDRWFTYEEPTTDVACLLVRPIPSEDFLKRLESQFGQSWFDGRRSITDPRFNDGTDRFPFWVLSFWKELAKTAGKQTEWKRAITWLNDQVKSKDIRLTESINLTVELFNTMGWESALPYIRGETTNFSLCQILSWNWLSDDHIDMMMEDLAHRVSLDPGLVGKVIVAPLSFSAAIKKDPSGGPDSYTKKKTPLLYLYEHKVKNEGVEKLYYPIHIHDNHWIAAVIDFERKIYGYGEYSCV